MLRWIKSALGSWFAWGLLALLAPLALMGQEGREAGEGSPTVSRLPNGGDWDPCCAHPCTNKGVCLSYPDRSYICDCTDTGFHGENCTKPYLGTRLKLLLRPSPDWLHDFLTSDRFVWRIIDAVPYLTNAAMKYIYMTRGDMVDSPNRYDSDHPYPTLHAYFNETYYGRTLPPVPHHCPTPLGIAGPKVLPPVEQLVEKVFARRKFLPEPHDSNALFQYYAQHFTHQFFRTDYAKGGAFTKGTGGVDVSNIYGLTEQHRRGIRLFKDGMLKYEMVNGEMFPPYLKDVEGVTMEIPPHIPVDKGSLFALGHPFFVLLPGLFMYSTLWLREHNRVCSILKSEHSDWDDERLYQTAKLIITGEVIQITIEDYVQHLSQYKLRMRYRPEVAHGTRFQFDNRINVEFVHLYHWHPLVPETIKIGEKDYGFMDMAFSVKPVLEHGLDQFIQALSRARAGKLGARNHPKYTLPTLIKSLNIQRNLRFQSFNNYRKRFDMPPYETFEELTGETEIAQVLRDLYGHVDAVEYYVGLICERPSPSITPLTMVNIGGPWSVKGLVANPVSSPKFWKPSTFGGEVGFDIIKAASLTNLLCNNMVNKTGCEHISFKVPPDTLM